MFQGRSVKKKTKKGKRELIIEIGREQILYSDFKKSLDKRVKEISKYDEDVKMYFNLKEAAIYCVSESGKQLKIDLWSDCYE